MKKGDMFGFGIRGDWESEFHAGPHCRLYLTLNGTEVWTVGLINCLIINWLIYWFIDQLIKCWINVSIEWLIDLLIYWTDDKILDQSSNTLIITRLVNYRYIDRLSCLVVKINFWWIYRFNRYIDWSLSSLNV